MSAPICGECGMEMSISAKTRMKNGRFKSTYRCLYCYNISISRKETAAPAAPPAPAVTTAVTPRDASKIEQAALKAVQIARTSWIEYSQPKEYDDDDQPAVTPSAPAVTPAVTPSAPAVTPAVTPPTPTISRRTTRQCRVCGAWLMSDQAKTCSGKCRQRYKRRGETIERARKQIEEALAELASMRLWDDQTAAQVMQCIDAISKQVNTQLNHTKKEEKSK